jgi:FMN phosphatase YigB (HAD superfamily)
VINTLLIDLDDTLLVNDTQVFIPEYLKRLSQYLDPLVPADKMTHQLYVGTQAMLANRDLERTLEEVFAEKFFPALGIEKELLLSQINTFYAEEFPKLQPLTACIPSAHKLIRYALENQMEVVVATNPLFPLTAIEQRLDWAGLDVEEIPFAMVTSYESFHFAKPHLEYVTEILSKLGRNPHEAAMIGNDPNMDLAPAVDLGLPVFHISENPLNPYPGGTLEDAISWLRELPSIPDSSQFTTPETLLARLRGILIAFKRFQKIAQIEPWKEKPSSDSWAPVEVLCHLRDVEQEINFPRIKKILEEDKPFLTAPDSDRWTEERNYIDECAPDVSTELVEARTRTLELLERYPPQAWTRPARHAIFGPTQLTEIVRIFVEHDLLHIRQINDSLDRTASN